MMNFKTNKILFVLLLVVSSVWFSCTDVIKISSAGLEIPITTPTVDGDSHSSSMYRASSGTVSFWQLKAQLVDEGVLSESESGVLQTITRDVEAGKTTVLVFNSVELGKSVRVYIELLSKDTGKLEYSGSSDVFTVLQEGNSVNIRLKEEASSGGGGDSGQPPTPDGGTTPSQPPATGGITNQAQLQEAIAAAKSGDEILIENTITIQDTLVIDKDIKITSSGSISLLRSTSGAVTGPMIEVKMGCELDLSHITLDGQWDNLFSSGENNPLIYVNSGTLLLTGVELKNNHMVYWGVYTDKSNQQVHLYSAAAIYALDSQLMIMDSSFKNFSASDGKGGVINIEGTYQDAAGITISGTTIDACAGDSSRALQMGSDDTKFGYISYDINNEMSGLGRQIVSITPNSP